MQLLLLLLLLLLCQAASPASSSAAAAAAPDEGGLLVNHMMQPGSSISSRGESEGLASSGMMMLSRSTSTLDLLDTNESITLTAILDDLLSKYDKRIRPGYINAKKQTPVNVNISVRISSVSSISEVNMDFTVDMYFRQRWQDKRLAFAHYLKGREDELEGSVNIAEEMLHKIWWPDTFFANAKKSEFHHATTRNAFLRIDSLGNVFHSLRLTVTAMCPMDLTYFPMDAQICSVEIESFGYTTKDIRYHWDVLKPLEVSEDVRLPQYVVRGKRKRIREVALSTGNYSRLAAEFYFARSMGYYLIQIYIPSTLIVVLSWVSFWLSRTAVPARVALGITTVLTMTTLISSTNAALPKISYLKSIDVFLVTCFFMVFASLLEYAAVSYIAKRTSESERLQQRRLASNNSANNATDLAPPATAAAAASDDLLAMSQYSNQQLMESNTSASFPLIGGRTGGTASSSSSAAAAAAGGGFDSGGGVAVDQSLLQEETPFLNTDSAAGLADSRVVCNRSRQHAAATSTSSGSSSREADMAEHGDDHQHQHQHQHHLHGIIHSGGSNPQQCRRRLCISASTIDKYSRILFPLCFTAFNIIYWLAYLRLSDGSDTLLREFDIIAD